MSRYCLIERWDSSFQLPDGAKAVALTQEAIFGLEASQIPCLTLEDYYFSGDIRDTSDEYIVDQLHWFKDFDELIKKVYPLARHLDFNAATTYYYWIKYSIDNIILTARILEAFIEKVQPQEISFVGIPYIEDYINILLNYQNAESTYSRLVETVCEKYNITFERLGYISPEDGKREENIKGYSSLLKGNAKAFLRQVAMNTLPASFKNFLRDLKVQKRYLNLSLKRKSNFEKNINILIAQHGYFLEPFYHDLCKENYCLSYKMNEHVYPLNTGYCFNRSQIFDGVFAKPAEGINWKDVEQDICKLLNFWFDKKYDLQVGHALMTRLMFFVQKMCPELIARTEQYKEYFQEKSIGAVIMHCINDIDDHAMVAATNLCAQTKLIGFSHGADAFESKSRFFYIIRQFDMYCPTSDGELENDLGLRNHFNYKHPVITAAPYFSDQYYTHKVHEDSKSFRDDKKTVLFVPIMCVPWPNRPMDKSQPFPMEYISWHKALVEYFSKQENFYFIWKGYFRPGQKFDYIQSYIEAKQYDNIAFSSDQLSPWLSKVDLALYDIPSTAFFEGIAAGLPTLALYDPEGQVLRDNALKEFEGALKSRTTIDEGLKHVEAFLYQPENNPKVKLQMPQREEYLGRLHRFIESPKVKRNQSIEILVNS